MPFEEVRELSPVCDKFHPESRKLLGFMPWRAYECEVCSECGHVVVYWGLFKMITWRALVGWWWDGRTKVFEHREFPKEWRNG